MGHLLLSKYYSLCQEVWRWYSRRTHPWELLCTHSMITYLKKLWLRLKCLRRVVKNKDTEFFLWYAFQHGIYLKMRSHFSVVRYTTKEHRVFLENLPASCCWNKVLYEIKALFKFGIIGDKDCVICDRENMQFPPSGMMYIY